MPFGERPVCPVKIGDYFGWLYTAVCPFDGDLLAMFLSNMNVVCFAIVQTALIEHIEQKVSKDTENKKIQPIRLLMDRATCHTTATPIEQNNTPIFPPACPELNPAARFFKELRRALTLRVYHTLETMEHKIKEILQKYWEQPALLIQFTNFPYFNTQ